MADLPILTREQWAAISIPAATLIAQHCAASWYRERAAAFERESLAMVMMGRLYEARGCKGMAAKMLYLAHVEETNPGPPVTW